MLRSVLLVFLISLAAYADTSTYTSCTAGTTTVSPCGGSYEFPGGLTNQAQAGAAASDSSIIQGAAMGLPPINGQTLSVGATAVVYGEADAVSATAQASANGTYATSGAARSGFIEFDVSLSQIHGGDSTAVLSDGTHVYSYDALSGGSTPPSGTCFEGCNWTGLEPFTLGVPFSVSTSAAVTETLVANSSGVAHGNTDGIVEFELFEADGATPVSLATDVPEPAAISMLILASVLLVVSVRGTRTKTTSDRTSSREPKYSKLSSN